MKRFCDTLEKNKSGNYDSSISGGDKDNGEAWCKQPDEMQESSDKSDDLSEYSLEESYDKEVAKAYEQDQQSLLN